MLAVLGGLLVLGALADRATDPEPQRSRPTEQASVMPTAAPGTALSSTWYCAGATPTAAGPSSASVVIANRRDQETRGTVTVVTITGPSRSVPVRIAASSVAEVSLGQLAPGSAAAAVVDLQSGQNAAELAVSGPQDGDVTPCASAGSGRWHFADGSTARDASLSMSLFNPFPEDAIADLSFSSDQGRAVPADLQGVVVPARSLVVKEIGEHVRRREAVATTVTVRTGRLVAAQSLGRTVAGRAGISVSLGAPSTAPVWHFPDGLVGPGLVERYSLYNPAAREAQVGVEVSLDEGSAEPFELTVPAADRVTLTFNDEARIPKGVGHAVTVRSLNGVDVVATRVVEAAGSSRSGRADTLGARRAANRWLFAAGGTSQTVEEWVVVYNPGPGPASVSLAGLADARELTPERLQGVTIEPGRRRAFRIGEHLRRTPLPIVVTSTSPVMAERAVYTAGRPGLSAAMGVILG